jgi:hypothetical protein
MMAVKWFSPHPFWAFVAVVLLCRGLGDFYPFNKFPMYANPADESSEFVVVVDGSDTAVPIRTLTGETSAKVKKKYISVRNELAEKAGIKEAAKATSPEICAAAWSRVAGMLRRLAASRKKELPPTLKLRIGMIYQESDRFREEWIDVGEAK